MGSCFSESKLQVNTNANTNSEIVFDDKFSDAPVQDISTDIKTEENKSEFTYIVSIEEFKAIIAKHESKIQSKEINQFQSINNDCKEYMAISGYLRTKMNINNIPQDIHSMIYKFTKEYFDRLQCEFIKSGKGYTVSCEKLKQRKTNKNYDINSFYPCDYCWNNQFISYKQRVCIGNTYFPLRNQITIHVNVWGSKFDLDIDINDKIEDIKLRIQHCKGYMMQELRIFYAGRVLRDDEIVYECDMSDGSKIYVHRQFHTNG